MLIAQVANFYGPRSGGIRTTIHELGRGYRAHGHDVLVLVPGEVDDDVQTAYGRVVSVAAPVVPRSGGYRVITDVDAVCTVLASAGVDRLELSDRLTLRGLGWWARAVGVPAVMWAHERVDGVLRAHLPGPWPVASIADRWNRSTARRFDRIVCSTAFAREEFDRIGWPHVAHVPLGVDLEQFAPSRSDAELRGSLLDADDEVLLVLCSRLSREKQPGRAIESLVELRRRGVAARLVVAGTGPMRGELERRAAGLPVTWLGHLSERQRVAALLASADVVLAPGPIETFGLAALESLASGTPVVASRSSALREIVTDDAGRTADDDAVAFAEAVLAILARPEAQRRGAARARAELFPWSRTVRAMLGVHGLDVPADPVDATA